MSEPARLHPSTETVRPSAAPGPLRDWLAAMRSVAAADARPAEAPPPEPEIENVEIKAPSWAPRLVVPPRAEMQDDDLSEIMAENMMLKAKLRLEAERRDELQILLAQEIRELRGHIHEEMAKLDDLRAERDLWMARCEALAQPLFQPKR